jgi:acyl-CoA synthetase (NDP forming)
MLERPAIREARVDGFLIEEMTAKGTEIVIGAVKDPQFGHMIMVGLGGIFVEVLKDVSFRICPISRSDGYAMLNELKGAKILEGVRGRKGVDKDAIVDILLKIGGDNGLLMTYRQDIQELDINPIIATSENAVAVDARFILSDIGSARAASPSRPYEAMPVVDRFMPLFAPQAIAVLGASTKQSAMANTFIRRMQAFGYPGNIYPIHPKADEIEGLKCYPSLADAPEPIDYAYIAIGARQIPDVLAAASGNVKFAQVISSGFGEVAEGHQLQKELVEKAHAGGCRVIGPNCLGLYSPRGGVTFPVNAPKDLGTVGIVSQSGGLGTDIIKRGQWRGLRFSGLVTVGNSADLGPVDLFEFYLHDSQTQVIGLYMEDIKEGRRFFNLLHSGKTVKPVVILRGGTSTQGKVATASHTGAMAGNDRAWEALSRQTGCVLVETVDEFINALLAFQFIKARAARPTKKVTLFGNGGGSGVLATDFFAGLGLDVSPFNHETLKALEAIEFPPGTSVANPIDTPVATLQKEEGRIAHRILDTVYTMADPDAVVMHLNLAAFVGRGDVDPIDNLIKAAEQVQHDYPGQAHFIMVLRVDGSPELEEKMRAYRDRILAVGIPVYDELSTAAKALQAVSWFEHNLAMRG